jgi:hypothetical protein
VTSLVSKNESAAMRCSFQYIPEIWKQSQTILDVVPKKPVPAAVERLDALHELRRGLLGPITKVNMDILYDLVWNLDISLVLNCGMNSILGPFKTIVG